MSDLVSRLLAAIEEAERNAEKMAQIRWFFTQARRSGQTVMAEYFTRNDPAAVLRRCAVDRKLLELHAQVPTHEGSTKTGCKLCLWEYSWGCDVQEGICDTVKIVAEGYGISVEEETTGE